MNRFVVLLTVLLWAGIPSKGHASFAKELLACQWSSDEYLLLRASLPRSGTGYYYLEKVTASGREEILKFEDSDMNFMHSAVGGNTLRSLSSVYFLNDGRHQFLAHFFKASGDESLSGAWLLNLPGYRTDGFAATSCMECEMDNNYCRDLGRNVGRE